MAGAHWTLDDVPWGDIAPDKVPPQLLAIVKAAALVEYNSAEYARYLLQVFAADPEFQGLVGNWADEEIQHGAALGRWAALVDPGFEIDEAVQRFRAGFKLPEAKSGGSVRGSRTGELVARCMVETGTSSFYSAIADVTEEPVLHFICRRIAADEFRHYKLFLTRLKPYQDEEQISRVQRAWVGVSRVLEIQDDELAYAYYVGNCAGEPYIRKAASRAYEQGAFSLYRPRHIERAVNMAVKAWGLNPQSWWVGILQRFAWWALVARVVPAR